MSVRLDRVVTDLDKEIADCEAHLTKLREARRHAASARDAGGSRSSSRTGSSSIRAEGLNGSAAPAYERILDALRRIMANGEARSVTEAHKTLLTEGRQDTKPSVNAALSRGAVDGGPFEKVGHGLYRLRAGKQDEVAAAPQ